MATMQKVRIGQLLVDKKLISESQLQTALEEQKRVGRKLGHMLIELGMVEEDEMLNALAEHLGLPFVDLKHYRFDPEIVRILPEMHARRFRTIVLNESKDGGLLMGMADPTDIFTTDKLHAVLQRPLSFAIVRESELTNTIDLVYRRQDEISSLAEELGEELAQSDFDVDSLLQTADIGDAPVVKLIHSVFTDAVQVGASDIHIEPDEALLRVRLRSGFPCLLRRAAMMSTPPLPSANPMPTASRWPFSWNSTAMTPTRPPDSFNRVPIAA